MASFPCVGCGACCQRVTGLPLPQDETGRCLNLAPDNTTCTIYSTRPLICRVDDMKPRLVPRPLWHWANWQACKWLHREVYGSEIRKP